MKRFNLMAIFLLVGLATSSCNEQRQTIYQVELGISVSERANVDNVVLFFFNGEGQLLGGEQGVTSTWFDVAKYQSSGAIGIVAWGNVLSGGVELDAPLSERSSHREMLEDSSASFAGHRLSRIPPDLFFGVGQVSFVDQYDDPSIGNNRYIVGKIELRRVVASYAITVRNARSAFGASVGDLTLLVRNPHSGLDFSGAVVGSSSYSVPSVTYNSTTDELKTAVNIALPTGNSSVVVEIYKADQLLFSTASYPDSSGLRLAADTFHNIVMDAQNQSTISIIPAHWGDQSLDELFD